MPTPEHVVVLLAKEVQPTWSRGHVFAASGEVWRLSIEVTPWIRAEPVALHDASPWAAPVWLLEHWRREGIRTATCPPADEAQINDLRTCEDFQGCLLAAQMRQLCAGRCTRKAKMVSYACNKFAIVAPRAMLIAGYKLLLAFGVRCGEILSHRSGITYECCLCDGVWEACWEGSFLSASYQGGMEGSSRMGNPSFLEHPRVP